MRISRFLLAVLVLAVGISAQAYGGLVLQKGDVVTYKGPDALSYGGGGAFDWTIKSVVASPASSPVGTNFTTFCTDLTQYISMSYPGPDYKINNSFTPVTGGSANASGKTFTNLQGVYLLDLWSNGKIAQTLQDAEAVQIGIWQSEGYTSSDITSRTGYSSSLINDLNTNVLPGLLLTKLTPTTSYSTSWTPTDIVAFDLVSNANGSQAQDQIVLASTSNGNNSVTPEPVSLAVWGIGSGLAAAGMAVRRRKQSRGRWSEKSRQAILEVIKAKQ